MNTTVIFDKYFRGICDVTELAGEDLGAVRYALKMALEEQYTQESALHKELDYLKTALSDKVATVARLQGLEDRLLAWLDEHRSDLPIILASDYDQYVADVIIEVLNQQRVTVITQREAIEAQKDALSRMRQQPAIMLHQNGNGQVVAQTDSAYSRNGYVAVLSADPIPQADAGPDPQVPIDWPYGEALYVELHRLARDGCGPSKPRYDDERAHGMPKANEVIATTGKRWFAILKDAGLKAPIRAVLGPVPTEAAPDGDATFRD